jgi:PIN like domain
VSPRDGSRRGHPEGLPTLFIDRSLGRVKVPTLLREAGLELVTLAEHYGMPADEKVEDVTWLAETAARGWVVLGKDERIRRRPAERAAIRHHGVRCFYFTRVTYRRRCTPSGFWPTSKQLRLPAARTAHSSMSCTRTGSNA